MNSRSRYLTRLGLACGALLLAGCGSIKTPNLWPFGGDKATPERSRTPANATEYQCAAGKRFYLRTLDDGAAMWLILAERELRLDRIGSSQRYSKGNTVLELGDETKVTDGAAGSYSGCKPAVATAG